MSSWNVAGQNSAGSRKAIALFLFYPHIHSVILRGLAHTHRNICCALVRAPCGTIQTCLVTRSKKPEHENELRSVCAYV